MPGNNVTDEMVERAALRVEIITGVKLPTARAWARPIIEAALADHVVVPREPTDDILKAGYEAMFDDHYNGSQAVMIGSVWDAMIAAAQPAKEG